MKQPELNYHLRPLFSYSGPVWMLHMAVQYPDMPIHELHETLTDSWDDSRFHQDFEPAHDDR